MIGLAAARHVRTWKVRQGTTRFFIVRYKQCSLFEEQIESVQSIPEEGRVYPWAAGVLVGFLDCSALRGNAVRETGTGRQLATRKLW